MSRPNVILVVDGFIAQVDREYVHMIARGNPVFSYPLHMLPNLQRMSKITPEEMATYPSIVFKRVARTPNHDYYEGTIET